MFFDECESAFRSRDRGGDRLLNALLTEIERHEGIKYLLLFFVCVRNIKLLFILRRNCVYGYKSAS